MDAGLATGVASVAVSLVAAGGAWASAKAAGKANKESNSDTLEARRLEQANSLEAHRLEQAYERARAFDIQTIAQQDKKIKDQDEKITELEETVEERNAQIVALRHRLSVCEFRLGIKPPEGEPE